MYLNTYYETIRFVKYLVNKIACIDIAHMCVGKIQQTT